MQTDESALPDGRTALDFYYWSYQCPIHRETLSLLAEYRNRLAIRTHDVAGDPAAARAVRMFFPALTVTGGQRYFSPLSRAFLEKLCRGILPDERPDPTRPGTVEQAGVIRPITAENCAAAARCTARDCPANAQCKSDFLRAQGLAVFGFINQAADGRLLGGAEYMPSLRVPYAIPQNAETAFITCVYLSGPVYDWKSAPLRALEAYLAPRYRAVCAVTDETGTFPNGDLAFFLRNGYRDEGVLSREGNYAVLHLVTKRLG